MIILLTKHVEIKSIDSCHEDETSSLETATDSFLESISLEKRVIFLRRYWFCDTYTEIAYRYGISERKVKRCIQKTQENMCDYLGRAWGSFGINRVDVRFIREAEGVISLRNQKMFLCDCRSTLNDLLNYLLVRFFSFPKHA